uniref:Uncharacterized protein n=1 Tax=Physcomitrium patens TaxID=3218 RepID=A0A2K1KW38_PHYPA|nr:hypothetical protein PHYPA_004954 [Physcomitrium patens]
MGSHALGGGGHEGWLISFRNLGAAPPSFALCVFSFFLSEQVISLHGWMGLLNHSSALFLPTSKSPISHSQLPRVI